MLKTGGRDTFFYSFKILANPKKVTGKLFGSSVLLVETHRFWKHIGT
jgi:hypothetical protein